MRTGSIAVTFGGCNVIPFVPPRPRRTAGKSASVLAFPPNRSRAICIIPGSDDPWLVLAGSRGWVHGDHDSATADAQWLADNFGLPIRDETQ
jgi:hypothetical protein